MQQTQNESGFTGLGLSAELLSGLNRNGFRTPTPIQAQAVPVAVSGRDLFGIAQTGTGKSLAFLLPLLHRLQNGEIRQALVLAPTRELALQIEEEARKFTHSLGYRTAVLIGGASMINQVRAIKSHPNLIIATPGRLLDHLQSRSVKLGWIDAVVLDEADRMLDMGFLPAITRILEQVPAQRQTMLFSATMPKEIEDLAHRFLRSPERIEVSRPGTAAQLVRQELISIPHEEKPNMLGLLLKDHPETVLVFARTRHGARKLAKIVRSMGHSAAEIHSDRTMAQRKEALDGFKRGQYRVLVATDIASRGIDVKNISLVVNYDLPDNPEDYVHRIGRTGRAGEEGVAITLATPDQAKDVRAIEKILKVAIPRRGGHADREERPLPPHQSRVSHQPKRRPFRPGTQRGPKSFQRKKTARA
ncbi:MAG TPA: DEAD/DEAH box helicase [Fimbriimonas sp.]|nr:DEAD/DEAH box helicase [Fimbriimonas sp.]